MIRRTCLTPKVVEEFTQRKHLFSSRCTINGRVCTFIIDSGSTENVIAESAVPNLDLVSEPHPSPYKLGWLHQGSELTVTRRTLVHFSVGGVYKDQIYCNLVPMDACHLLLGQPWEFDKRVTHDGFLNTYTIKFNDRTFTLKPSVPTILEHPSPTPQSTVLLLQQTPFEREFREEGFVLILVSRPTEQNHFSSVPRAFAWVF